MIYAVIIFLGVVADQLSKMWAAEHLMASSPEVIPGVLSFTYVENTGMAFGMGDDQQNTDGLLQASFDFHFYKSSLLNTILLDMETFYQDVLTNKNRMNIILCIRR